MGLDVNGFVHLELKSRVLSSSEPCPYCAGTGNRRSTDTTALEVIRAIEELLSML